MRRPQLLACLVAVQILVPVIALFQGVPSRFGFHMFADTTSLKVDVRDAHGRPIDVELDQWVGGRHELDWPSHLPPALCRDVPGAATVVVVQGEETEEQSC